VAHSQLPHQPPGEPEVAGAVLGGAHFSIFTAYLTSHKKTMERKEEFVFETLASIRRDEKLLDSMLREAKVLKTGGGRILHKGDLYTNKNQDSLYHVLKVDSDSRGISRIEVELLFTTNPKTKGLRSIDYISGDLFDQEIHVLAITRKL
jgi:hypothetical protein